MITLTSTDDRSSDDQRADQIDTDTDTDTSEDSLLHVKLAYLQRSLQEEGGETPAPMDILFEDPAEADAEADVAVESGEETAVETDSEEGPNGLGPALSRCESRSTGTGSRSKWQSEYRTRRGSGVTEAPGSELRSEDKENESPSGATEGGTGA